MKHDCRRIDDEDFSPKLCGVAAAIVGGAVIGAVASNSASNKQEDAAEGATNLQRDQYNQTRADQEPWRQAGMQSLAQLNALMQPGGQLSGRFDGSSVANDPGFMFAEQQGLRAVDNSASARGGIGGAAIKAGARFAQGNANQFFNDAFNRWNTENTGTYNRLANIAGLGQQSVAQVGAAGQNFANQAGSNMIGAGNAQAANYLNQGNIYGNALNQYGAYGNRQNGGYPYGSTRGYDPYSDPNYFGGGEGE